jgi:hypothetical protein
MQQQQRAAVDAYKVFSLPVNVLDAFGSLVSSGPGSSWIARIDQSQTQQQQQQVVSGSSSSSRVSQLSGNRRVRFVGGSGVFSGLLLAAAPGSLVNVTLTAEAGTSRFQVGPCCCFVGC